MKNSSRRNIVFRLLWAVLALCVLMACGYIMVNNLFHSLPPLLRILALMIGWILAFLLILKALPEKKERAGGSQNKDFPSPALKKILDTQEALQIGFAALDSHGRVILSNSMLGKLLDVKEASSSTGLARVLHPDNAHVFKNTFQEVCQSASGTTTLQLRCFDRVQQVHHLQVALARWKESPVAVIGMLWDISDIEQSKQEAQTVKAALHDFHGVFAADGSSLLDTMRALLELGRLHFKVEIGLVAKLKDNMPGQLEIVQVLAPREELSRGDVFDPLAVRPNFPRVLMHSGFVCGDQAAAPPVFKATREETFIGAPIYLQRHLFGVLCFASPQDRPEGFTASELELVQFIANWLGGEIDRQQLIEGFEKRQKRLLDANATLETLLRNDLLTGLYNRMALDDLLHQEFERARTFNLPLSLIALAPNDAEAYRKNNGDDAWRKMLEQLSLTLERHVREFDIVARCDESTFVVVCPHSSPVDANLQAEKLQNALTQISPEHHNFTTSVGIVSLSAACSDSKQLLAQALGACQLAQSHAMASHG